MNFNRVPSVIEPFSVIVVPRSALSSLANAWSTTASSASGESNQRPCSSVIVGIRLSSGAAPRTWGLCAAMSFPFLSSIGLLSSSRASDFATAGSFNRAVRTASLTRSRRRPW